MFLRHCCGILSGRSGHEGFDESVGPLFLIPSTDNCWFSFRLVTSEASKISKDVEVSMVSQWYLLIHFTDAKGYADASMETRWEVEVDLVVIFFTHTYSLMH